MINHAAKRTFLRARGMDHRSWRLPKSFGQTRRGINHRAKALESRIAEDPIEELFMQVVQTMKGQGIPIEERDRKTFKANSWYISRSLLRHGSISDQITKDLLKNISSYG